MTTFSDDVQTDQLEEVIHGIASADHQYDCGGKCRLIARGLITRFSIRRNADDRPRELELTSAVEINTGRDVGARLDRIG